MNRALLIALLTCGPSAALATSLDLSGSTTGGSGGTSVRVGLSDLPFGGGTAAFGVSDRAVDLALSRGLDLSALGTVGVRLSGALAFRGGWSLSSGASGTVGPVALGVSANVWTTPLAVFDPISPLAEVPTSMTASGWTVDLTSRYRVNRDTQLLVAGTLGQQPNVAAGGEWRRGDVSFRAGARYGDAVLGATGGVTYRGENATLALDALVGPSSVGATGSLTLPTPIEDRESNLRLYFAYEPWRTNTLPLRYGAVFSVEAGRGQFTAEARGGSGSLGARVAYTLPLGGTDEEDEGGED